MRTAVADDEPDRPVDPVTVTVWSVLNTATVTTTATARWSVLDERMWRPPTNGSQPRWTCS